MTDMWGRREIEKYRFSIWAINECYLPEQADREEYFKIVKLVDSWQNQCHFYWAVAFESLIL